PLAVRQAEEPLLEDGILPVPQGQGKAEMLSVVRDPGQPVLTPSIGARARLVVAEVIPGIPRVAVVLTHRAPLPLGEIRAPLPPGHALLPGRRQPLVLSRFVAHAHTRSLHRHPGAPRYAPGRIA